MDGPENPPADRELEVILPGPESAPPLSPVAGVFPRWGEELFAAVRARGCRGVALQLPAGLTRGGAELARELGARTGARVSLLSRACFGACDVPSPEEVPGAEAVVALGHSPIPNVRLPLPTFFVEMRLPETDPEPLTALVVGGGLPKRLGVVSSVQHMDLVEPLRASLGRNGFDCPVRPGDRRLAYPAQALGCNYSSSESVAPVVEGFLFLGTGEFHPLGLALATSRPVWSLDPLQRTLAGPYDRSRLVARRLLYVAKARDARRWGILVSSFPGQYRPAMAEALRRRAEAAGRSATPIVFSRLDPRDLEGRELDAYVNTACPRIAIDDAGLYPKPILTPPEFLMALGELPLEPYRFDTYR